MDTTLKFYDENAKEFASGTIDARFSEVQNKFLGYIPQGGYILDFGCGAGRDTKFFTEAGYDICAIDASETLCKEASAYTGVAVKCMRFDELSEVNVYDGIFACASLLHVPAAELPAIITKIRDAIKPGGILYASLKYGDFEGERDGRFFHDMNEGSVTALFDDIESFDIIRMWQSHDVRRNKDAYWINVIVKKPS